MAHENPGYIKLIECVEPTAEQRSMPDYRPQLRISPEALTLIEEKFESPISILVYVGNAGVGKSKLASLTVAALQNENCDKSLNLFRSGQNVSCVTVGIWMWRIPLKSPNQNKKKGSILLLDCEGMDDFDKNRSDSFYLFCMIISTAFAVILRPPRAASVRWDRLNNALRRFEEMDIPYVLPKLLLVPLDLKTYTDKGEVITPSEWLEKSFNVNTSGNTLSSAELQQWKEQCSFIQKMLPITTVANIGYLPEIFRNDMLPLDEICTRLQEKSSEDYYGSLSKAIDQFTDPGGKRLPGSNSLVLFVRPAELTNIMSELIDVLNRQITPNADELIGKYLLIRFNDVVAKEQIAKFKNELLTFADRYAKDNLETKETTIQKEQTDAQLAKERDRLKKQYIAEMKKIAEKRIYGSNSKLIESYRFKENLHSIEQDMDHYQDPEIFITEIRSIYNNNDNQESRRGALSTEARKKLERLEDLILGEERINQSIMVDEETGEFKGELKVEVEKCASCNRPPQTVNLIHVKGKCSSGRSGNYFRYHTTDDQMVCDACRKIEKISVAQVKCGKCARPRRILRLI